ncbi:hypothetical protein PCANC_14430 [Puccinia coronata f. sp. avenae]|uniref:Uncharacterized protein n=1 Tax=Puccinia coronata f. sp. avenae TaxID=200324 RepID=A0A2N5SHJ1_9BASI|nr:hypothetical protein PCANC_14430 [Puccinia coronata f. sp. avenae]
MSTAIATPQANYDQAHQHDPSSSDGVLLPTKKRRLTYILPLHLSSTAGRLKLPGKKDWVDSFSCSTSPGFHHSPLILPVRSDDADHKPVSQPPSPSPSPSASHEDHYHHHDYHPTHSLGINSLAIDLTTPIKHVDKPNGILYSAGRDGLIAAWELNLPTKLCTHSTGQQHPRFQVDPIQLHQRPPTTFRQCIQSHTDWCNDILLCNQNQTLISASSDRTVKAWSPHSPQNSLCPTTIGTHQDYVKCLTHSPFCAWVASAGLDRRILLWDTNESRPNPLVKFSENLVGTSIYSLTTTPTGQLLAAGSPAQAISLYDPRLSSQVAKLVGHTDNVRSILLSEDGSRLLSASSDATVKMWDVRIQRCLHTFSHHSTSVWALHSQHPRLEMFHSGDRAGWLCKVDLEACADFREGECVVLGQAGRREHLTPDALNAPHQGIAKIVALDDAFVWTATGSSTVERWKDIPTRIQRRQAASLIHSAQDFLHSPPPDSKLTSSRSTFDSNYSPPQSPHQPPQLAPHPCSPQSVSFNVDTSSSSQSSSVVHHPPLSSDPAHDPLPPSSTSITQSSPQFSSNTHLPSHVQPDELDGVPLEALVPLFSQFDHLLHHPESQDPESTTIHSPNSVVSDPNLHKAGLNYFTHSSMSTVSLRPPTFYGLEPIKILSPLTLETKLDNLHTPTVINPHPHTPTVINPHPRPSITTTSAWKLYITRDSAAEAVPLRDSPDDTITGCSGLTKSELLNDGRHAITIDTMGRIALWDIISCSCKGVFDPDDLERKFDSGSSVGSSRSLSKSNPSELLKLVKERIEGQATVGTWCTVEIQTGLLAVHLDENRCFDGEVYADEAGLSEEVLGQMKEDHRISLGKWIISNLFEGFVKHQTRLRLQNEVTAKVPNAHDATSPTNTIQSGGEVDSDEQKTSDERSEFSYSHHLAGKPFVPRTPGMTIALATTALTPAILPDLKTVVGSNWATKNNQHGGDSASHHHDYFSLPRLVETDEEQLADGGVTPGGLDSCTDASSSYSSSLNPLPSPRRASPALASNDGFSNGQLAESSAASWTSTATTSSSAVQPNSANIFSRFRSLGRGQKRRNSQDQNAPPVISNPIPYREDGDQAEQDAQKRILAEKTKVQQAHMVQSILSQPFQPCGEVDAPKLTLPPETTILISEEEPESGAWEVSYRGLVSTTHLDIDILMNVLPGWLLGFLHGNRVSAKEGGGAIKVTFVLQPEDGKDIVGLPELPNGNARLTASRVLRMKKVAAYVFQKLESSAPKHDDQHEPPPPSSSSSSKTPSESAYQHKSHKANSKSIGSAASTGSSATTTSNTNHHHHQHHQHHHHSNHHRHHKRETLDHQPHATNGEVTPTSASPHPYPQAHQPPLDETQIVLSCNGKLLPRSLTLGVVKQWVWARPGDVVIHYRRDTLALPT